MTNLDLYDSKTDVLILSVSLTDEQVQNLRPYVKNSVGNPTPYHYVKLKYMVAFLDEK
jgi:hypothetical protein